MKFHPVESLCFISRNILPLFLSKKHSVLKSISYKLCLSSLSTSSRTLTSLPSLSLILPSSLSYPFQILKPENTISKIPLNFSLFHLISGLCHIFHKKLFFPWLPTSWLMQKNFSTFLNIFAKCCCTDHTFHLVWAMYFILESFIFLLSF